MSTQLSQVSSPFYWWQIELYSPHLGTLLLFLWLSCIRVYMHLCVCVFVPAPPEYHFCQSVCVPAGSDSQHTNLFNSLGAWATDGGPYLSWLLQPLKQAPGLLQRLGPKPRLHSPHQPSCLFSEALEETLDKAYQIQTVARLCYFTHRPPLNSASFSVIVFFLAQ